MEEMAKMIVRRRVWVREGKVEESWVKVREPSMTEDMKEAKIMPRGRGGDEGDGCVDLRKGVQKKTKRYMLPSKKQEARPRVKIRGLVKISLRADGAGGGVLEVREGWLALGEVGEVSEVLEVDFGALVALSP